MYRCAECGREFETPYTWVETHGLDQGPYERFYGCPFCLGGDFHAEEDDDDGK